jgi:hypothetical protein
MLKSLYVCATTAALALSASSGHAMSINIGAGVKPALDATDVIQKAAVYIVEGRPYCFYFDGWHGAGWYRCGFAHRRNLGWGGEYGWQGWSYGPAEKRYGHGGIPSGRARRSAVNRRSVKRPKAQARTSVAPPPFAGAQLEQDRRAAEKSKAALRPQVAARCRVVHKAAPRPTTVVARRRVVHKAARAAVARSSNARSIRSDRKERGRFGGLFVSKRSGFTG